VLGYGGRCQMQPNDYRAVTELKRYRSQIIWDFDNIKTSLTHLGGKIVSQGKSVKQPRKTRDAMHRENHYIYTLISIRRRLGPNTDNEYFVAEGNTFASDYLNKGTDPPMWSRWVLVAYKCNIHL
jgi:hypothetical protein